MLRHRVGNACMWYYLAAVCPVAADRALHCVAAEVQWGVRLRAGRINCPQGVIQVNFQTY